MPEIDLKEILEEIRRSAEERRQSHPEIEEEIQRQRSLFVADPDVPVDEREMKLHLKQANLQYDTGHVPSEARLLRLKRLMLRLVNPYIHQQVGYNAVVVRVLNKAADLFEGNRSRMAAMQKEIDFLKSELTSTLELVRLRSDFLSEDLRKRLLERIDARNPERRDSRMLRIEEERLARIARETPDWQPLEYGAFEDRFRGSEAEIKNRQRDLADLFLHHEPVVDLGCGRGEFLELLAELEVEACGVESDPTMVDRCREKGLSVEASDAFEYLESKEDESQGGILLSHVIEHYGGYEMSHLLSLCWRKLQTGGLLVVESPNPASLFAFAHSIYLDPTHIRPYHPLSIDFLCRNLGFSRCELQFRNEVDEEWKLPELPFSGTDRFNHAVEKLNQILFAPQDYRVIAYK